MHDPNDRQQQDDQRDGGDHAGSQVDPDGKQVPDNTGTGSEGGDSPANG